jgi:hypothetical protein
MITLLKAWASWVLVKVQVAAATVDPEVLQWPGGSIIACLLWSYATARSHCSVGAAAAI